MDNISYVNQTDFELLDWERVIPWIEQLCADHGHKAGEIAYLFCDDEYLLEINKEYLKHETFTDIITFDYTFGKTVSADILISVERVAENARNYKVTYQEELARVMAHGLLHCMGFRDKTADERDRMRKEEEYAMQMLDNQMNI